MAVSERHSLAIANDGKAHGWGDGWDDALGLQLTGKQLTPLENLALLLAVP